MKTLADIKEAIGKPDTRVKQDMFDLINNILNHEIRLVELERRMRIFATATYNVQARIDTYDQIKKAKKNVLQEIREKRNESIEKHHRPPKYIIADFTGLMDIKFNIKEFDREAIFSEREGYKFMGMDIIKAEECIFILKEDEEKC